MIDTLVLVLLILVHYLYITFMERKLKSKFMSSFFSNLRAKRRGSMCHTCGFEIIDDETLYTQKDYDKENIQECCSCKRENSLNFVLGKKLNFSKFNKFVLSKKFEKLLYLVLGIDISVIFIGAILVLVFKFKINLNFSNYILIIYWLLNIYKTFVVYKNKQKVLQSI